MSTEPESEPAALATPVVENAPAPPQPGFWWAALAAAGFLLIGWAGYYGTLAVAYGGFIRDIGQIPQAMADHQSCLQALVDDAYAAGSLDDLPPLPQPMQVVEIAAQLAAEVASLVFAWCCLRRVTGRDWRRVIAWRRPSGLHLLLTLLVAPGLTFATGSVDRFLQDVLHLLDDPYWAIQDRGTYGPDHRFWAILAIGVGPGLSEELMFRGFVGRGLVGRHHWVVGIVLTSVLFGAVHLDPIRAAGAMVMGLLLHAFYVWTRSLWIPILLHTFNNGVYVLDLFEDLRVPAFEPGAGENGLLNVAAYALTGIGLWCLSTCRVRYEADASVSSPWQRTVTGVELPPAGSGVRLTSTWPRPEAVILTLVAFAALIGTLFLK